MYTITYIRFVSMNWDLFLIEDTPLLLVNFDRILSVVYQLRSRAKTMAKNAFSQEESISEYPAPSILPQFIEIKPT